MREILHVERLLDEWRFSMERVDAMLSLDKPQSLGLSSGSASKG